MSSNSEQSLWIPDGTIYGPVIVERFTWERDRLEYPCIYNRLENKEAPKKLLKYGITIEQKDGWACTYLDYNRDLWRYWITFFRPPNGTGYHTLHRRLIKQGMPQELVDAYIQGKPSVTVTKNKNDDSAAIIATLKQNNERLTKENTALRDCIHAFINSVQMVDVMSGGDLER